MLNTQDAHIPVETFNKFRKPLPLDIAVIKTKSKGERVSVKGIVEKVKYNEKTSNLSAMLIFESGHEVSWLLAVMCKMCLL